MKFIRVRKSLPLWDGEITEACFTPWLLAGHAVKLVRVARNTPQLPAAHCGDVSLKSIVFGECRVKHSAFQPVRTTRRCTNF